MSEDAPPFLGFEETTELNFSDEEPPFLGFEQPRNLNISEEEPPFLVLDQMNKILKAMNSSILSRPWMLLKYFLRMPL